MTAHLLQSTVFAGIAVLLAFAFRKQRAGIRYWIWLAASLKFMIPFAVLIEIGTHIPWPAAMPAARPHFGISAPEDSSPIVEQRFVAVDHRRPLDDKGFPEVIVFAVWIVGAAAVVFFWTREWRRMRQIIRSGVPLPLDVPIRAVSVPDRIEPGVVGIFRPVLVLPEGIVDRLSPEQLHAIILHESCHIRRRDNLAAFLHMIVEAAFWFHPLVWWIERRLVEERERACDEEVIRLTSDPESYAESILNVCRFYTASPAICVSGVTGAELRKRIEDIMKGKVSQPLNAARKFVLASAGGLAMVLPLLFGFAIAPQTRAQSESAKPIAFEVASIKMNKNPDPRSIRVQVQGGRYSGTAIPLRLLISQSYGVPYQSGRILTAPEFDAAVSAMAPAAFDIEAVAPQGAIPEGAADADRTKIVQRMLQSLLADRFKLVVRRETKELQVYAVVIGKNGPKLKKADVQEKDCANRVGKPGVTPCHGFGIGGRGRGIHADAVNIADIAEFVEGWTDRPVVDKTGLTGLYNIQTTGWRPEDPVPAQAGPNGQPPTDEQLRFADPSTPTLSDIFDQLGLKLESQRAPVETWTLVSVQRPTEN